MTRDEVMALSDDELRNKAAELAGWRMLTFSDNTSPWRVQGINPTNGQLEPTPDYPHDIAAAWELMPTLIKAGFAVDVMPGCLTVLLRRSPAVVSEDRVEASFYDIGRFQYVGEGLGKADATAITRAFVLAMAGDK